MAEQSLANLYATKANLSHTHAGTDITSTVANATNAVNATNATVAANISNAGTVTLASAKEANEITITQPVYSTDQPTKLLNFRWYDQAWSLGTIRGGSTENNGFGVFLNGVEKFRFKDNGLYIGLKQVATTDQIPTTLPANGGNSNTVGGVYASSFVRNDNGNQTISGNLAVSLMLSVGGSLTDLYDGSTWYGIGRSNTVTAGASSGQLPVQVAGYFGLRLKTSSHTVEIPYNGSAVSIDGKAVATQDQLPQHRLYRGGPDGEGENNYYVAPHWTSNANGWRLTAYNLSGDEQANIHVVSVDRADMSWNIPTSDVGGNIWIG